MKRLFTSRKAEPVEPEPEVAPPAAAKAKKKPRVTREPIDLQATAVSKRPDAKVVLVIGDFMGSGLAEGLSTAFVDNPHVTVVDRTNGSSGFVRDDFYDWPARIGEIIDAEEPAAVVVMMGANDRQQMSVDGSREAVRSEAWNKAYAARTQALAKAITSRKVPFIWVGVPSFKSSRMLLDMLAFNEMFRAAATGAGAEFVDIWDGFVDEDGGYVSNGPDLNGQPARLRAADGINLARPGKRKLAFYAEKPLAKLLGDAAIAPADDGSTIIGGAALETSEFGLAPAIAPEEVEVVVGPTDLGPIAPGSAVSLRSPALDGGTELLGLVPETLRDARTIGEMLAIEGKATEAMPGRADDFSWPQAGATVIATAFAPPEATTGKGRVPAILAAFQPPAAPIARPAMITTPEITEPPVSAMPTALPAPEEPALPGPRPPVKAAVPVAKPQEDPTLASKGPATLPQPGSTGDRSPSRASPAAAPDAPLSSGPSAEGAPTALPLAPVEPAPVAIEVPVAAQPAPTTVAALSAQAAPTGDRANVPRILRKAPGDAAPVPSAVQQAVRLTTTSGPAPSAAPLAPAALAEDLAQPKMQVGRLTPARPEPTGRLSAPTDPDKAVAQDLSPLRAAPALPDQPPAYLPPPDDEKAPPALIGRQDDTAPDSTAPTVLALAPLTEPEQGRSPTPAPAVLAPDAPSVAPAFAVPAIPTDTPDDAAPASSAPTALAFAPATTPEQDTSPVPAPAMLEPVSTAVAPTLAAPSALIDMPDDAAPASSAPTALALAPATAPDQNTPPTPAPAMLETASEGDAPAMLSAPSDLPDTDLASLQMAPPAMLAPPPTDFGVPAPTEPEPDAAEPSTVEPTAPAVTAKPEPATIDDPVDDDVVVIEEKERVPDQVEKPIIVPDTDFASLLSVPGDLSPAAPAGAAPVPVETQASATTTGPVASPLDSAPSVARPELDEPAIPAAIAEQKVDEAIASLQPSEPGPAPAAAPVDSARADADEQALLPEEIRNPVVVPETDFASLQSVPPDLVPAEPIVVAPEPVEPPAPAASTEPAIAPVEAAPAVVEDKVLAPDLNDQPIIVPETDFASLLSVPPDLEPAAPIVVAPKPVEPPLPVLTTEPAVAPVEAASANVEQEALVPDQAEQPIIVPDTDFASLLSVPPDLDPALPAGDAPPADPQTPDIAPAKSEQTVAKPEPVEPEDTEASASLQPGEPEPEPSIGPVEAVPTVVEQQGLAPDQVEQPIIVPETDFASLLSVPPDLEPASTPAAAPKPVEPASSAATEPGAAPAAIAPVAAAPEPVGPTPPASTTVPESGKPVAALQPEANPAVDPIKAPTSVAEQQVQPPDQAEKPIIVPETDFASLLSVPPDLMEPSAVPQPGKAPIAKLDQGDSATDSVVQDLTGGKAATTTAVQAFPLFDSVDDIPAPRLDTAEQNPAAAQ